MYARRCAVLLSAVCCLATTDAQAVVLWTEGAENGLANIATNVAVYPLVQSEAVSQGANAFHLANPSFADNWFRITQPITVQADSKLFFQSRLGVATSQQVARVQASTDGGGSWPISLFNQAGSGGSGEGGFNLKQVNLGAYAAQTLQLRFYYDFTSGSAFIQTTTDVGWIVDDIQIADQFQKSLYSIGNPSNDAQLYLEYINRARANALAEANRLANETDPQILSAYSSSSINGAAIISSFTNSVNSGQIDNVAQPLSFNAKLIQAATLHTQDLFNNEFQGHDSSGNPPAPFLPGYTLGDRLDAVGYSGSAGENVFSYAKSVRHGHAGFDVDWDFVGFQSPPGHRISIHNDDFKEIGVGVVNGTNDSVGPQLVTQDFGDPGNVTFVTGVVYQDLNANSFYDVGEGRSGVRVDVDGSAFYAMSSTSGGYSVPVSGNGLKNISFTGGGFATFNTTSTIVGGNNVKVDYLVTPAVSFAADFNDDTKVDGADFTQWKGDFGETVGGGSDADGDGDSDGRDFLLWQRQYGSGVSGLAPVPEPAPVTLAALAIAAATLAPVRRRGRFAMPTVHPAE